MNCTAVSSRIAVYNRLAIHNKSSSYALPAIGIINAIMEMGCTHANSTTERCRVSVEFRVNNLANTIIVSSVCRARCQRAWQGLVELS